jgi:hypothetical protein
LTVQKAKHHSTFAPFVRPTALAVQGQCTMAKLHSTFAQFVRSTALTVQGRCTRNDRKSTSQTPFIIRGIWLLHFTTITLANAICHSIFAAFVRPSVQDNAPRNN